MLEHADDITTIIREAEGGFYKLTEKQQPFLRPRVIDFKTPESFFTQNIAFNALQIIFRQLEIDFEFDSSGLFSDATTTATYTRMQELTSHSDVVDDFLTGALITGMLQHLMVTQSNSPRPALPLRFINTFSATQNNARAIANAFDLKRKDGLPALKVNKNEPVLTEDIDLLDTHIHGSLANPLLTNSKNTAALLTTSILVAEQMLLEQLLRDACKHGLSHPNAKALKAILANSQPATNESEYNELVALASKLPSNEFGPILGLQFPYCEPIVVKLRKIIGIHYQKSFMENVLGGRRTLIDMVNTLYQMDTQIAGAKIADIGNNYRVIKGFKNLFYIGQVLQDLNGISVRHEQSRGVNAGLIAVIQKLAPVLYAELVNSGKFEAAARIDPIQTLIEKSTPHPILEDDSMSTCPYIRAINAKKMAEETSSLKPSVTSSLPSNNSWSSFFRKHATGIILTTGAASTSMIYFANRPA